MIDVAEMLRVEEVGRPRRDVGEGDEAARLRRAFGERRHLERAAGGAAHVVAEVGLADVAHGEAAALGQRHAVAVQAVPGRMAAGRDRGRRDARHRREDGAMVGAQQALPCQVLQGGRPRRRPASGTPSPSQQTKTACRPGFGFWLICAPLGTFVPLRIYDRSCAIRARSCGSMKSESESERPTGGQRRHGARLLGLFQGRPDPGGDRPATRPDAQAGQSAS